MNKKIDKLTGVHISFEKNKTKKPWEIEYFANYYSYLIEEFDTLFQAVNSIMFTIEKEKDLEVEKNK